MPNSVHVFSLVTSKRIRRFLPLLVILLMSPIARATVARPPIDHGEGLPHERYSPFSFRKTMPMHIHAGHPLIRPVADAIRSLSEDPLERLSFVHQATRLLVEYDSDLRVYGQADYHATLDQMIARKREAGWANLRDDCDGRAVFAAHLLESLGIPWRLEASSIKRHAWVSAEVHGVRYDVLDLTGDDPELQGPLYRFVGRWVLRKTNPPPRVSLRQAWLERAGGDATLGVTLGLLESAVVEHGLRPRFEVNHLRLRQQVATHAISGSSRAGTTGGAGSGPRVAGQ